jgi:hypothetical protein
VRVKELVFFPGITLSKKNRFREATTLRIGTCVNFVPGKKAAPKREHKTQEKTINKKKKKPRY